MLSKKIYKKRLFITFLFVALFMMSACNSSMSIEDLNEVEKLSENITEELTLYTDEVSNVSSQLENIYAYSIDKRDEIISKVDKSQYNLSDNGIFYRQEINEGSAVFVSGYTEIDDNVKDIVYLTEGIDLTFKTIVEKYPEIAQVYYNDENSYNRIYPSFDVLTQYQAKMNIPDFNFYYLADLEHNPEKKAVWVKEPYVDPAGRGWMVSTVAPVYENDYLHGVAGIDLTINGITEKYLQDEELFMITSDAMVVTISEKISTLLSLPVLKNHRYIETIKSDSYLMDDFNLMKSKNEEVRNFAYEIINSNESVFEIELDKVNYRVTKSHVDNLDWIILKMVRK